MLVRFLHRIGCAEKEINLRYTSTKGITNKNAGSAISLNFKIKNRKINLGKTSKNDPKFRKNCKIANFRKFGKRRGEFAEIGKTGSFSWAKIVIECLLRSRFPNIWWHFWRGIISDANRELKCPIVCNNLGLLLRAISPRDLGNFEPWLAVKLSHFWRQMDWPGFPQIFWKILGGLTFLTRPNFERYQRTKMAHFLQHSWPPPGGRIFPEICPILSRDYLSKGAILETSGLARISPNFLGKSWKNWHLRLGRILHAARELKWPIFCNIPSLFLRAEFSQPLVNFEPRLAVDRGHFWRQLDWPWFPQYFGAPWEIRRLRR